MEEVVPAVQVVVEGGEHIALVKAEWRGIERAP